MDFQKFLPKNKPSVIKEKHKADKKKDKAKKEAEKRERFKDQNAEFKGRFTKFSEENKAYAGKALPKARLAKKFDRKDANLEAQLHADYNEEAKMPLNKFIARAGVSSRRDAVTFIKEGKVMVNGEAITEPGYKVQANDVISYEGKILKAEDNFTYILLNKPKGYITTTDDPKGRKTVLDLFQDQVNERIFPIGRLDRNTTGLLLLTNDGDLAQNLAHPKYNVKKVYQVLLDKPITQAHFDNIKEGLTLEDGPVKVDDLAYLDNEKEIGIEIHSGKNRIVRRIFESLGYEVIKLDRVLYAGLTKKNLPRGKWRQLTRQEIINLKHFNQKKANPIKANKTK